MTLGSLSAVAQDDLWFRLSQVSLDVEGAAFPFSSRLARDNGWSEDFAVRVIEEYRRFAYLAVTGAEGMTHSDAVDQAWHLHLTYTRHYWGEWTAALGTELHHGPTKGGHLEAERFEGNYLRTLTRYRDVFEQAPPKDIWPSVKERFRDADRFVRLDTSRHIIFNRFWRRAGAP